MKSYLNCSPKNVQEPPHPPSPFMALVSLLVLLTPHISFPFSHPAALYPEPIAPPHTHLITIRQQTKTSKIEDTARKLPHTLSVHLHLSILQLRTEDWTYVWFSETRFVLTLPLRIHYILFLASFWKGHVYTVIKHARFAKYAYNGTGVFSARISRFT